MCEVGGGGEGGRWRRENRIAAAKENRIVVTSSKVGIEDIGNALDLMTKNLKCRAVDSFKDPTVFSSIITFIGEKLILIGLIGETKNVEKLKIWSLNLENLELEEEIGEMPEEIGEMPKEMLVEMKRESFQAYSLSASFADNWVFIYSSSQIKGIYMCEVGGGGEGGRWRRENRIAAAMENRMVVTSSNVGIEDIRNALDLITGNWKCRVVYSFKFLSP